MFGILLIVLFCIMIAVAHRGRQRELEELEETRKELKKARRQLRGLD